MTIKENIAYLRYFGFKLTFWKSLNHLFSSKKNKLSWKIKEKNNNTIENYIKKICSATYKEFMENNDVTLEEQDLVNSNLKKNSKLKNNVIWTMWWQGEKNAPKLVKACISSMRKNSNGHPVIVLDKDNIFDYIKLPEAILKRYKEGEEDKSILNKCTLDNTRLSDVMRTALLSYYGGLWCDATIFFSDKIPETLFYDEWSTLGQDNEWYIGKGKWSSFFMSCHAGNALMKFVYKMHIEYFTHKEYWVNYLLIDYIVDIAYKDNKDLAAMIDNVNTGNKKCLTINRKHDEVADIQEIEEFLKQQQFHKLSWRWWGNKADSDLKIREDGKLTWFGYLYEKYIKN